MIDTLTKRHTENHTIEVAEGERFAFGENWKRFLANLDHSRISEAEESLKQMMEVEDLIGKRFLDIGSGSGLFSLAARRLGASVHSFDYDPHSVACAEELRRRYFPGDDRWAIEEGSALDESYIKSLGSFDVVYSWGVLHHTGMMWQALDLARMPVADGGKLFIAIYNDLGSQSRRWRWIKRTYNRLPRLLRTPYTLAVIAPGEMKSLFRAMLTGKPMNYTKRWREYSRKRGMSRWRDIVDWVGGHPYEVASPEEIFDFFRVRGFRLTILKCRGVGLGCNEFVFEKEER